MGHRFAELAFTDSVRQVQFERHSREGYAAMDSGEDYNYILGEREIEFIQQRDSFYMASVSESGWPYVQHRGGPAGFLKVLDKRWIGFADYSGNRQYISTGNFRADNRIALILMDYPGGSRLKILGQVSEIGLDDWRSLSQLEDPDFRAEVERGFVIQVEAFDWNCPKYITPRYTEREVDQQLSSLRNKLNALRQQNQAGNHSRSNQSPAIGNGPLELMVTGIRQLTPRIRSYELRSPSGDSLPPVSAGSHLPVPVKLADGSVVERHYSISSASARRDHYEIAVLRESDGRGGSAAIHQTIGLNQVIRCGLPRNYFPLLDSDHPYVLIAGGIGITPIRAMATSLQASGKSFFLHYVGRQRSQMAFIDELEKQFPDSLSLYESSRGTSLNLATLLENAPDGAHFYACGPATLLDGLLQEAGKFAIERHRLHTERFSAVP